MVSLYVKNGFNIFTKRVFLFISHEIIGIGTPMDIYNKASPQTYFYENSIESITETSSFFPFSRSPINKLSNPK